MKNKERMFWLMSAGSALIVSLIVYAPVFTGKIPFPADFVFDFPPFAPIAPSEGLLPHTNIGDLVTSFYPYRTLAARAARQWVLPLWNPYMLSGAPFLASAQSALFYPGTFLYYFLPVSIAWSIGFFIRRALAAFFTALFVRRIGGTPSAAIASGLIFAFCGFLTAWQGQAMSDAATWLPLICYSIVRLSATPDARSIAVSAFAFAMPVLAGHPETAAHLTLTGLALAVFVFARQPRAAFMKAFIASGLLAMALAAVQILPTLEWLRYIHHSLKDPWPAPPLWSMLGFVVRDSVRAKSAIGLLIPEHAAYLAMLAFVSAPIAFMRRESRGFAVFFAVLAVAAGSAAFYIGPVHWLIRQVAALSMLKNTRLILVVGFSIAVLAGLGLSFVEECDFERRQIWRAALFGFAGFVVAAMLLYVVHLIPVSDAIEVWRAPRTTFVLLLVGAITIGLRLAGFLPRRAFAAYIVVLAGLDVATVSRGAIPFTKPRDVFPPVELFERLPKPALPAPRIAQVGFAYGANFESMYGRAAVGGYEIPLERIKTFLNDVIRNEMDSVMLTPEGVLGMKDRRLDMLNARYYIVSEWYSRYMDFRNQPDRFRYLYTYGDTDVYENPRALGPAYMVPASGVEVITDEARQLQRIKDPTFDAEHCVVLPISAPAELGKPRLRPALISTPRVEVTSWRLNDFDLAVNPLEPSVLVISQIDYPGWKAYLDDGAVPIVRANYALPAVFIPAGLHHVRFSFEPWTFRAGLALTVVAACLLGIMIVRGAHRSDPNRL